MDKIDKKIAKKCLEKCIIAQATKVDAMNPLDENYQKEVANLIALMDVQERRKPKINWLEWFKAFGEIGLRAFAIITTLTIASLSYRSSEEMKLCDGRIFNLKNDLKDTKIF